MKFKKIIGITIITFLFVNLLSINVVSKIEIFEENTVNYVNDSIIDMIQKVDKSKYLQYLDNLISFGVRVTGSEACFEAGKYIFEEFSNMNIDVRYHNWSRSGYSGSNIEATIPGFDESSDEIYIFCAHYDTVESSIGVDDDGSGIAAVLTLADLFINNYNYRHTIKFVAFSGEEQGLHGSYRYGEEAYGNSDNIIATLSADMIGYASNEDDMKYIRIYDNQNSEWITEFTEDVSIIYNQYVNLSIVIDRGPNAGRSDHAAFWVWGYDAIWIQEYHWNEFYHSSNDLLKNMNIDYVLKVTKLILATLAELSEINNNPSIPSINGEINGEAGVSYDYIVNSVDLDGDQISYCIDWGDGTPEICNGPFDSGVEQTFSHSWDEENSYTIRVKARDINGAESDWATLEVSMPKNKITDNINSWISILIERFPILELIL